MTMYGPSSGASNNGRQNNGQRVPSGGPQDGDLGGLVPPSGEDLRAIRDLQSQSQKFKSSIKEVIGSLNQCLREQQGSLLQKFLPSMARDIEKRAKINHAMNQGVRSLEKARVSLDNFIGAISKADEINTSSQLGSSLSEEIKVRLAESKTFETLFGRAAEVFRKVPHARDNGAPLARELKELATALG